MYLTKYEVRERVRLQLKPYWSLSQRTYAGFAGERFFVPAYAELRDQLGHLTLPAATADEAFDCDDLAFAVKGLISLEGRRRGLGASFALGIAWGQFAWMVGNHAVNWFLDDAGIIRWIEPQDIGTQLRDPIRDVKECRNQSLTLLLV